MADKSKIRLMAKMAVYDKKEFERDAGANQYFRHDFIYKKNMQMRFHVGLGCLILAVFYLFYLISIQGADIFALNFQAELMRLITFVIIVMVGYSFLGTIVFTREFLKSQKRVEQYFALMRELNGEEQPAAATASEEEEEDEEFEPYRRTSYRQRVQGTGQMPVYNYKSSDDPEFWEDDK
ncbi:MAG: hypothetical protein FWC67_01430 [Defluviitaleaceae bacterium]|nr:hypothetical protein [Defluviitaleaceae bacterium]